MNRIDRLFGILLLLQTKRKVRAQDVAEKFEITPRTVYRDMSALMQLGVPIVAQAGEGYALLDHYFLPPLVFTPDEAKAIFLGLKMLQASGNFQQETTEATAKLKTALPNRLYSAIVPLLEAITFFSASRPFDLQNPTLITLQQAIEAQRVVFLRYLGYEELTPSERHIEPTHLMHHDGVWYVTAYCRLRRAMRSFRLEHVMHFSK